MIVCDAGLRWAGTQATREPNPDGVFAGLFPEIDATTGGPDCRCEELAGHLQARGEAAGTERGGLTMTGDEDDPRGFLEIPATWNSRRPWRVGAPCWRTGR